MTLTSTMKTTNGQGDASRLELRTSERMKSLIPSAFYPLPYFQVSSAEQLVFYSVRGKVWNSHEFGW